MVLDENCQVINGLGGAAILFRDRGQAAIATMVTPPLLAHGPWDDIFVLIVERFPRRIGRILQNLVRKTYVKATNLEFLLYSEDGAAISTAIL